MKRLLNLWIILSVIFTLSVASCNKEKEVVEPVKEEIVDSPQVAADLSYEVVEGVMKFASPQGAHALIYKLTKLDQKQLLAFQNELGFKSLYAYQLEAMDEYQNCDTDAGRDEVLLKYEGVIERTCIDGAPIVDYCISSFSYQNLCNSDGLFSVKGYCNNVVKSGDRIQVSAIQGESIKKEDFSSSVLKSEIHGFGSANDMNVRTDAPFYYHNLTTNPSTLYRVYIRYRIRQIFMYYSACSNALWYDATSYVASYNSVGALTVADISWTDNYADFKIPENEQGTTENCGGSSLTHNAPSMTLYTDETIDPGSTTYYSATSSLQKSDISDEYLNVETYTGAQIYEDEAWAYFVELHGEVYTNLTTPAYRAIIDL